MSETNAEALVTDPAVTGAPRGKFSSPVLLNLIALVLSFVGIFVASVVSLSHAFALSVPCGDTGGCDTVTTSSASMIFGLPVAYLGASAYIVLAAISALRAFKGLARTGIFGMVALAVSGVGALFSFYLQYVSFTQIHAVCLWCLTSAITMCVLFLVQAGIAQLDVPPAGTERRETAVMLTVGLTLLAGLGIGYESLHFVQTAPKIDLGEYKAEKGGPTLSELLLTKDSMHLGPESAPIKIVEFSDLVCPSCKDIYPDVKALVNDNPGKVELILRHRPLTHNPDHKMALPAAFLAEYGAESGKGWAFVDAMYTHDNADLQTLDSIYAVAKSVGIDVEAAKKRMKDSDIDSQRVLRDLDAAGKIDIATTPTFVIFAPKLPPQVLVGHALLSKLEEPEYQAFLKGNGS